MGVTLGTHFRDLFAYLRVLPFRGYAFPPLGYISGKKTWAKEAEQKLKGTCIITGSGSQGPSAGCDLRGGRPTFKVEDNMSPKKMNRQGEQRHAPQSRAESDAGHNSPCPERRASLSPCFFYKQDKMAWKGWMGTCTRYGNWSQVTVACKKGEVIVTPYGIVTRTRED